MAVEMVKYTTKGVNAVWQISRRSCRTVGMQLRSAADYSITATISVVPGPLESPTGSVCNHTGKDSFGYLDTYLVRTGATILLRPDGVVEQTKN